MPPLPASKFGQSAVIGRDARGGLFPLAFFPARVTVEPELLHSPELSGVHAFPKKNKRKYTTLQRHGSPGKRG